MGHTLGADWKYNDSNHWKECEDCGAKVDEAAHTFAWVTDKPATAPKRAAAMNSVRSAATAKRRRASRRWPLSPTAERTSTRRSGMR